jgi:rare lipoprotein A
LALPATATAAVVANAQPPQPVLPVTADAKGVFLQLGAFGSQDNADNYLARLKAQVDWLGPSLHVYTRDGLFRVHTGPYANPEEARQAADRLAEALGIKPIVVNR